MAVLVRGSMSLDFLKEVYIRRSIRGQQSKEGMGRIYRKCSRQRHSQCKGLMVREDVAGCNKDCMRLGKHDNKHDNKDLV